MDWNTVDYYAIALSLKVAVTATLVALPLGLLAAYLLVFVPFRGKLALELLINLPLTLPPVVVGYGLLLILGRHSWVGALLQSAGIKILFTWKAAVIASVVVGFPLLVRSIRLSMESLDRRMLQTAHMLGARPLDALFSVILPLSLRGVLAGAALLFARSLGEFGATIIVAGNIPGVTQTIPLAIYDYASTPRGDSSAFFLCGVSLLFSLIVLAGHEWLTRWLIKQGKI
jgi:molybdate transport system permease protein